MIQLYRQVGEALQRVMCTVPKLLLLFAILLGREKATTVALIDYHPFSTSKK